VRLCVLVFSGYCVVIPSLWPVVFVDWLYFSVAADHTDALICGFVLRLNFSAGPGSFFDWSAAYGFVVFCACYSAALDVARLAVLDVARLAVPDVARLVARDVARPAGLDAVHLAEPVVVPPSVAAAGAAFAVVAESASNRYFAHVLEPALVMTVQK